MEPEFRSWPKIPRWCNESYTITEKLDGTNACIIITEHGEIFAQSRSRILDETSSGDNYGFCKWVKGNAPEILTLGVGYHYGEWWGHGINRNYGLKERRFSLFNIWIDIPECLHRVPIVAETYEAAWNRLQEEGSVASPGYMNPEGFVMGANLARGTRYKVIMSE